MVRIKHAVSTKRRKKRLLKKAKGQFGDRSKRYQQAKRSVVKGMTYAYRDRRVKRRKIKRLWIIRINAACRENNIIYSRFINGLLKAKVDVDRKILADLAVTSPAVFKKIVKLSQESSNGVKKAPATTPASAKKATAVKKTATTKKKAIKKS